MIYRSPYHFVLLLINAFFAMSEIAIVSASKPLLKHLAKQGDKRGGDGHLDLSENPGRFLSTVQVGITLVGFWPVPTAATISEKITPTLNDISFINPHGESVAVALIVTAIVFLRVIGNWCPTVCPGPCRENCGGGGEAHAALSMATHPVVVVLEVSANVLMKVLGVGDKSDAVSDEEFRAILSEGAESGVIEKSEHEMLQRVIRLDDRDVKSIMTHRTETVFIDINDSIDDIRRKIHEAGHSRYPVIDGSPDEVRGIVQAKDLLDNSLSTGGSLEISQHLKDVMVLPEGASCLQALESFKRHHINLIVIVDEYGSTQGIVTSSDILEAIVGILPSNYDHDDQLKIVQRDNGTWLVDGRTPIEEIHLAIGLHEISADEDFDTIAGFMLETMRKAPREGVSFEAFGHRFEIVDMDGHRIDKVLIRKLETPAEE